MNYLLDTQVFLWFFESPERLSPKARELFEDDQTPLFLSPASSWEIAIKVGLGKLVLPLPPKVYVPERMVQISARGLPILHEHAVRVAELERHHRDPFDRLLIAQAQHESMTIVTADPVFKRYDVSLLDT